MSKAVRTILSLVVSMVLFNAVAMAHAGGDHIDKHKKENKEHHSRISKLAFWHHHKNNDKSVKTVRANHSQQKQAQVKAQAKPAPPTMAASKKDPKHEQHAKSKAPAKKTSAGTKTKPQEKAQGHTPA
jgi:hypothetical protein